MEIIFNDLEKIKIFSQVQKSLCDLRPNSEDAEIEKIINLIPEIYFDQKEDLMIICRLFAFYNRCGSRRIRGNGIKLFEKIMKPIKKHLANQSIFFFNIFGPLNYFKQWLYEEGLITFDVIIQSALSNESLVIAEYFLPEIIEKEPEIYEKVFKKKLKIQITKDYINDFKQLRKKHLNWIRESNDYQDPQYCEIEEDQVRYAIKTDNIDLLQSILSNSNISVESQVMESVIEQSFHNPEKENLLDYAMEFNSIKIFKYLIMNDAKFTNQSQHNSIYSRNYEMIHSVENDQENLKDYGENLFFRSIICWNSDLTQYAIENYDFGFIEEEEIESKYDSKILSYIEKVAFSMNFEFFESFLLPFLHKNPRFVKDNIYKIIMETFEDQSLFFTKEFLKFPGVDINFHSQGEDDKTILVSAIHEQNANAVELLLNYPNIDIESPASGCFLPFFIACGCCSYLKIIELFCKNPKFDINWTDTKYGFTAVHFCAIKSNFYDLQFIFDYFPDFNVDIPMNLLKRCYKKGYVMTVKVLLKYFMKKNSVTNTDEFFNRVKEYVPDVVEIMK